MRGQIIHLSPVVSLAGLFDFCQKNIHHLEVMVSITNSFPTLLLPEWFQLCLFYNPPQYLLWRYNYSCMLGLTLQTVEREQCFMIVMQVTALHTICFQFTRVALLGMDMRKTTLHSRLICCSVGSRLCSPEPRAPAAQYLRILCISCTSKCETVMSLGWWHDSDWKSEVHRKHDLVQAYRMAGGYWLSCWPVSCWLSWGR